MGMIVVTGAAGFIGSCIAAQFNAHGREDLILVDHLGISAADKAMGMSAEMYSLKRRNLEGRKFLRYYEKQDFLSLIHADRFSEPVEGVIHMGACSSTTLQDADYFEKNNFEYTLHLAQWALKRRARFIYASSAATYGDGSVGYSDDDQTTRQCRPLNLYGRSKQKFDEWVLDQGWSRRMTGLKFFNVFGPNEYHKGDMRSVIAKAYPFVRSEGRMRLFKSCRKDYADGEQKRDFIYIKDAVNVVMFFWEHPEINGIFNVGTGCARSWNDLAHILFDAAGCPARIEYYDMPEGLRERYQYFTQADMRKLRGSGYTAPFMTLEQSVADYVGYLREDRYL